ncbi:NAD(P)-dependent oxidoreductase [uncultured Shimia sp.]|uniref:NAD-dependent epimerase/dehydratase family protein n=1 Tax=uncultured Shimia sp. TaxID=573152 RepID=UPI002625EAC6|nr:NAD(P)-dependent oxidoreductase [uncultured Shimia sp.]
MSAPTLAITGATGFIGRHCVERARAEGTALRLFVRDMAKVPAAWQADKTVEIIVMDLTGSGDGLAQALEGIRTLIHCAATLSGDQERDTVAASVAVIDAVIAAQVPHVVLAGSLSVYDVTGVPKGGTVDETTPVNTNGRDTYAQAKLTQETLFKDGAALYGYALSILRLGAVWGPDHLFNAHIGPAVGSTLLKIDGGGEVPSCHVELAAQALIKAAHEHTGVGTLNILDDDRPNRTDFLTAFRACGWPKQVLPTPLWLWRMAAFITPDKPTMPGLLRRAVLEARHRPVTFSNTMMHNRLGPVTMLPFAAAMQAAIEQQEQQAPPS